VGGFEGLNELFSFEHVTSRPAFDEIHLTGGRIGCIRSHDPVRPGREPSRAAIGPVPGGVYQSEMMTSRLLDAALDKVRPSAGQVDAARKVEIDDCKSLYNTSS